MSKEYDALVAQARANDDLLDSFVSFAHGQADLIAKEAAEATELATLKASMSALSAEMKSKADVAAAALVSSTPAAAPAVTPPGPVPITPPADAPPAAPSA